MTQQREKVLQHCAEPARAEFDIPLGDEISLSLRVSAKTRLSDRVARLTLVDPGGAELPPWSPGSHIDLNLAPDLVRQYSLCGDVTDRFEWNIGVLHRPDGRGGSEFIHNGLAEGDFVDVTGPRNHFELVRAPKYLFIAGGIGITPLVPMIEQIDCAGLDWSLVYVGRSLRSMAFADSLTSRFPGHVAMHPKDQNRLADVATVLAATDPDTRIYACGPESLLEAIEAATDALGTTHNLHTERFTPKAIPEGASNDAFEVEFAKSGITRVVGPGESILDVARAAKIPASFSCSEGTCGTCETAILFGKVDHRDSILSREEQESNETLMICISRAAGPKLTLDM